MPVKKWIYLTLLIAAFCCVAKGHEIQNAEAIVKIMAKQFRSAQTYAVTGSLKTVSDLRPYSKMTWGEALTHPRLILEPSLSLSFFFDRPNRLRFDWLSVDHKLDRPLSIWINGKQGYSWTPSSDEKGRRFVLLNHSSLDMLLQEADFNGSSSMASILYSQLTGDKRAFTFDQMKDSVIIREEVTEGKKCFVILGTISNDPWALWIETSTFILRKMRLQISLTSFDEIVATGKQSLTIGEVSFVDPRLNVPIKETIFSYRPKFRKGDIDISK